jgi:dTDP-glucose pyrophosphorylase
MQAVVLAAGKGTRMQGLTEALPKPMLKVQGKPILEHILEGLLACGIRRFAVVTGWKAEAVEEYFGDGAHWGAEIRFARQAVADGTGKAAEPARPLVGDEPFLLTYGDILVPPRNYRRMLDRFAEADFSGLVTVKAGEDVTKGAINFFDAAFCLSRILEKPSAAQLAQLRAEGWLRPGEPAWYNAGIYMFKPCVFDFTARLQKSPRGEYELTDALSDMVAAGHRVAGLALDGRWVDVRDPAVLATLEREGR